MSRAGPIQPSRTEKTAWVTRTTVQWIGLLAAPALAALCYALLPDAYADARGQMLPFSAAGRATAAMGLWMAIWWMTEAIPVYATALLPLAVLPVTGAASIKQAASPYGHELIFLFMGPWGLLILFGGGLSLAAAIRANGVGELLGAQVGALAGLPPVLLILGVIALVIFLTELTSNTATTATLIPVLASLAPGLGLHAFALIVPAAIAASCAFMLPVATPPNAVVFGSGRVTIPQMTRAGLWLNLIGIALITALTYRIALPLLGVEL